MWYHESGRVRASLLACSLQYKDLIFDLMSTLSLLFFILLLISVQFFNVLNYILAVFYRPMMDLTDVSVIMYVHA